MISTGSKAIDAMLGGGIRQGMITDIFGESGSGKTQLCFTLSVNCVKEGGQVMFIDTAGTFRPERIVEISGSSSVLEKIAFFRALGTGDQAGVIQKIPELHPQLLILDTLTSLFSSENSGSARHLALMKHLHDLAISGISSDCAIVVTNMVRNVPVTIVDQAGHNVTQAVLPSQQREYLGRSVSIYSHIKMKFEIVNAEQSSFRAILVQPPGKEPAHFTVSAAGIADYRAVIP